MGNAGARADRLLQYQRSLLVVPPPAPLRPRQDPVPRRRHWSGTALHSTAAASIVRPYVRWAT